MIKYNALFGTTFFYSRKQLVMLAFLAIFPNLLGLIVLPTVFGINFHFFQYFIFLAAAVFGPFGGIISGAFGSIYTAALLKNPFIVIGNIILGFFTGYSLNKKRSFLQSVTIAFIIQLPWLVATDIFFAKMLPEIVLGTIVSLTISNVLCAVLADYSFKKIKSLVE